MKNKTKLVLMATGLSCAVLGCVGSATFAWFVTKNNIGVNHTNLTVNSTSPNLTVVMTRINPSSNADTTIDTLADINEAFGFSDVSSKFGEAFYKKNNNGAYAVVNNAGLSGAVLQYGLKVTNLALANPMTLRLNTSIDYSGGDAGLALRGWARMGVYECTDNKYDTKKDGGFAKAFMYSSTAEGANKYVSGAGSDTITTYAEGELVNFGSLNNAAGGIQAVSEHYYKVSIWMEGTVADDQDSARGGTISVLTSFTLA